MNFSKYKTNYYNLLEDNNEILENKLNYKYILKNNKKLIDEELINIINNKINETFINLNNNDKRKLNIILIGTINLISKYFYFKKGDNTKWKINNSVDILAVLNIILPFIDDKNNFYNQKKITNLSEIIYNGNISNNLLNIEDFFENNKLHQANNMLLSLMKKIPNSKINKNNKEIYEEYYEIFTEKKDYLIDSLLINSFYIFKETIKMVHHKLYTNWINLRPINFLRLETTKLYKHTYEGIDELRKMITLREDENKIINYLEDDYIGIYIGDFYNTLTNTFYLDIRSYKWLIFNIYYSLNNKKKRTWYFLQILASYVDLSIFFKYKEYDLLLDEEKIKLKNEFNHIFEDIKQNKNFGKNILTELIQQMIIFWILSHSETKNKINIIFNESNTIKNMNLDLNKLLDYNIILEIEDLTDNNIDQADIDRKTKENYKNILNTFNINFCKIIFEEINFKYLYDYLLDILNKSKNNPLISLLFNEEKINKISKNEDIGDKNIINLSYESIHFFNNISIDDNEDNINDNEDIYIKTDLKTVYNFSKSIFHLNNKDRKTCQFYQSFKDEYKIYFLKKILLSTNKYLKLEENVYLKNLNDIPNLNEYKEELNIKFSNLDNIQYSDIGSNNKGLLTQQVLDEKGSTIIIHLSNKVNFMNSKDRQRQTNFVYEWFNITTNIERMTKYTQMNNNWDKGVQNIYYYKHISNNITRLVLYALCRKGILNEFYFEEELNNFSMLPKGDNQRPETQNRLNKILIDKYKYKNEIYSSNQYKRNSYPLIKKYDNYLDDYNNCYYFWNSKKFKTTLMSDYRIKSTNKHKFIDFITNKNNGIEWYLYYSMNWIAQLNFYNNFIHQRVMFITGATGTGKSTQVPKLLLYGSYMIDYKQTTRSICSQPRISPTIGNSEWISFESGLQIIEYNSLYQENIPTDNFNINFKYQEDDHIKKDNYTPMLKIVTDGTLMTDISNNIFMKKEKKITEKKREYVFNKEFTENIYDIIIVDEAHEHNANMDIILTITRNSVYLNNSLRLVIVSATMDDDESIYRNYYKIINDNLLYPIKSYLTNPLVPLNTIFIDRRTHISRPGESTQFKVFDHYSNIKYTGNNSIDSKKAQEETINKCLSITKVYPDGQILLFSIGEKEIKDVVEQLNNKMAPGNIALPYFAKMNNKYKDIILKIKNEIKYIKNKRQNIHKEWGTDFIQDLNVPNNMYRRAVIIATNVAEASITIPGLKFVIDNGYSKEDKFDVELGISSLNIEKISDASRIQRRGRVGRKSSGDVFYVYSENARKEIVPKKNITKSDIHINLFDLLHDNFEYEKDKRFINSRNKVINEYNEKEFLPFIFDINNFECGENLINFEQDNKLINYIKEENIDIGLIHNINYQFIIYNEIPDIYHKFPYTSDMNFIKENNNDSNPNKYLIIYKSGFGIDNIIDKNGEFYIIHPEEGNILRDRFNNFVKFKTTKTIDQILISKEPLRYFNKISFFINKLTSNKLIFIENAYQSEKINFKKEQLGILSTKLNSSFMFENNLITLLILGYKYGIIEKIILMISLLQASEFNITNLIYSYTEDTKKFKNIVKFKDKEFYSLFNIEYSEFDCYYKIVNLFIRFFKDTEILKLLFNNKDVNIDTKSKSNLDTFINKYKLNYKIKLEEKILIEKLINKKILFSDDSINIFKQYFLNNNVLSQSKEQTKKFDKILKEWCYNLSLNSDTISKFIEKIKINTSNYLSLNKDYFNNEDYLNNINLKDINPLVESKYLIYTDININLIREIELIRILITKMIGENIFFFDNVDNIFKTMNLSGIEVSINNKFYRNNIINQYLILKENIYKNQKEILLLHSDKINNMKKYIDININKYNYLKIKSLSKKNSEIEKIINTIIE